MAVLIALGGAYFSTCLWRLEDYRC